MPSPFDQTEMWGAVKAVKADGSTAHVACTMEWLDAMRRSQEPAQGEWPDGRVFAGTVFGTPIYVTDDVTDPRGWEARPGTSPSGDR